MDDNTNSEFQPDLDSWDDFAGDYIKAEFIKEFPAKLVCIGAGGFVQDGKNRLVADVEYNKRTWSFDLNKTNQKVVRAKGLTPRGMIGKVFVVDKVKVRNPSTNSMVDSLVITDITDKA